MANPVVPDSGNSDNFLRAQYEALRAEILALEERGTRIQIAGLTGIPALLAAAKTWSLDYLIISSPVIIIVASLLIIFVQHSIMRAGAYIKSHIEPQFLTTVPGWERFLEESSDKQHRRRNVEQHTRIWIMVAFAFYYIVASVLACKLAWPYSHSGTVALAIVYGLAFLWAVDFIYHNFPSGTEEGTSMTFAERLFRRTAVPVSPLRVGLVCILAGILLTRIAVYLSHPAPSMLPDQIWHRMSGGLQAMVLASFCLFAYGCWRVLKGIVRRRHA